MQPLSVVDEIRNLANWGNPDREQALFSVDQICFRRREQKLKKLCSWILNLLTVFGLLVASLAIAFYMKAENPKFNEVKCIFNINWPFAITFDCALLLFAALLLANIGISCYI